MFCFSEAYSHSRNLKKSNREALNVGKFKNKTAIVTGFDTDDKNQPIIKTNKGDTGLKFRIKKLIDK